jgi:DNA gyrase subunit B
LPLKGKILNVERARFDRLISSQEIATLITALGTSIGKDEYNPDKLRYHRIIIMTDADVDGSHIRTLLLTFFYRQMPELVERGHIYIAQPPLYKIKHGKQERYLKDEHDLKQYLLQQAMADAKLVTESGREPLSKEAFEEIAKEYLLSEAVIERLARIIDREILQALLKNIRLDISNAASAENSARELANLLPAQEYQVSSQYDDHSESYRLIIRKQVHGNMQVSQLDQDFIEGGNYAQLLKTGQVLQGLLGAGAHVKRGEQQQMVKEFKQALDWLLDQVKSGISVQRYKGLGEMNPEQLWETTMDPGVRRLLKVQIDDAIGADEIFTTLMGDQVEPRRAFIETNALIARNIDI